MTTRTFQKKIYSNTLTKINKKLKKNKNQRDVIEEDNMAFISTLVKKIKEGKDKELGFKEYREYYRGQILDKELELDEKDKEYKKERSEIRKIYKDAMKEYWEKRPDATPFKYSRCVCGPEETLKCILFRMLYNWEFVLEVKSLTTMKNKEFLPQIDNLIESIKAPETFKNKQHKKGFENNVSVVKNGLSKILDNEKRLEMLEEYYEYNKNYVPNIIRLLKYADSKIQKYFERIETDKRIAERARISDEKTKNWSSEQCYAKDEETYRKKRGGYLTWTDENGVVYDYTSELFKKKCLGDKMNKMNKNFCKCCYNREQTIRKRYIIPNLLIGNHIRVSGFNKNISPNPIVMDKFGDNSFTKDESFMEEWDDAFGKEVMKQMDEIESKLNA
tara:strand:- start:1465 stop:2631 length:1167 start_codon:yes stop_codon:yes gene_type:complete